MADKEYHRNYWQRYRHKKRRITLTLSPEQHRKWERDAKANKITVGQQILAEAEAYRATERAPDRELKAQLSDLIRVTRGIGNNLNQLTKLSNTVGRLMRGRQTIQLLQQLEQVAESFIRSNHTPPKDQS